MNAGFPCADLKVLGAMEPILQQLGRGPEVQAAAARVLGVAASNNLRFQTDALEADPHLLHRLLQVLLTDPFLRMLLFACFWYCPHENWVQSPPDPCCVRFPIRCVRLSLQAFLAVKPGTAFMTYHKRMQRGAMRVRASSCYQRRRINA